MHIVDNEACDWSSGQVGVGLTTLHCYRIVVEWLPRKLGTAACCSVTYGNCCLSTSCAVRTNAWFSLWTLVYTVVTGNVIHSAGESERLQQLGMRDTARIPRSLLLATPISVHESGRLQLAALFSLQPPWLSALTAALKSQPIKQSVLPRLRCCFIDCLTVTF